MNLVQWAWGAKPLAGVVPDALSGFVNIGDLRFPVFRLFIIGFGLLVAVLLWLFQDKTKVGSIIRAGMDNRENTGALGINLKVLFTAVFALGCFVAGLCGLMGAPIIGIHLQVGWDALMLAMIVVIVGGTGSIQGTLLGAMIIGLVDAFGKAYFPSVAYFAIYVALILIFIFRPSGLWDGRSPPRRPSRNSRAARTLSAGATSASRGGRSSRSQATNSVSTGSLPTRPSSVSSWSLGPFLSSYYLGMLTKVLIYAIFAISLDLMMGYGGLTSMGHAAFLGVGGYTVGILAVKLDIGRFWLLLPAGLVAAAIVAAIIGYISLRVSGTYFLLVTIAFGQLLAIVATKLYKVTGGTDGLVGIPAPIWAYPGSELSSVGFYYLVFVAFAVSLRHPLPDRDLGLRPGAGGRAGERAPHEKPGLQHVGAQVRGHHHLGRVRRGSPAILLAYYYGAMVPNTLAIEMSTAAMLMVILGGPAPLRSVHRGGRGTCWASTSPTATCRSVGRSSSVGSS